MNDKHYKGHIAMLMANIIWGLNSPIGKAVLDSPYVTPLSLTTFRMVGAAIAFWAASLFTKKEHVKPEDLFMLFFAALFGIVLNQGSFPHLAYRRLHRMYYHPYRHDDCSGHLSERTGDRQESPGHFHRCYGSLDTYTEQSKRSYRQIG